jgi:hypothetical protein
MCLIKSDNYGSIHLISVTTQVKYYNVIFKKKCNYVLRHSQLLRNMNQIIMCTFRLKILHRDVCVAKSRWNKLLYMKIDSIEI